MGGEGGFVLAVADHCASSPSALRALRSSLSSSCSIGASAVSAFSAAACAVASRSSRFFRFISSECCPCRIESLDPLLQLLDASRQRCHQAFHVVEVVLRLGPGEGLDAVPVRGPVGGREQGGEAINRLLVEGAVDTRVSFLHNRIFPTDLTRGRRPWSIRIVTVARAVETTSGRRRLRLAARCQCGPGVVPRRERSLRRPCERRGISGLETPVSPGFGGGGSGRTRTCNQTVMSLKVISAPRRWHERGHDLQGAIGP